MGSGKSYWAHKAGKALGIPALDLDNEIEKAEGQTIAEIFAEKGESYFRLKENETLKSLAEKENFLLATGGGAPCFHDNMEWMNANGITIWIDEPLAVIAARLQQEKAHRPLPPVPADGAGGFAAHQCRGMGFHHGCQRPREECFQQSALGCFQLGGYLAGTVTNHLD